MIIRRSGYGSKSGDGATSSSLTGPLLIVFLFIMLGATLYLRQNRYIRRKTAYGMIAAEVLGILIVGYLMYEGYM